MVVSLDIPNAYIINPSSAIVADGSPVLSRRERTANAGAAGNTQGKTQGLKLPISSTPSKWPSVVHPETPIVHSHIAHVENPQAVQRIEELPVDQPRVVMHQMHGTTTTSHQSSSLQSSSLQSSSFHQLSRKKSIHRLSESTSKLASSHSGGLTRSQSFRGPARSRPAGGPTRSRSHSFHGTRPVRTN
jgi:hypothetical protein